MIGELFCPSDRSGGRAKRSLNPCREGFGQGKEEQQPAVRTIAAAVDVLRKVDEQPIQPLTKLASRLHALTAVRSSTLRLATAPDFEG